MRTKEIHVYTDAHRIKNAPCAMGCSKAWALDTTLIKIVAAKVDGNLR